MPGYITPRASIQNLAEVAKLTGTAGQDLTRPVLMSEPTMVALPTNPLEIRQASDESKITTATKIGMAVGFPIAGLVIILLLCLYLRERRLRKGLEWRTSEKPSRISRFSSKISHKTVPAAHSGSSRVPVRKGAGLGPEKVGIVSSTHPPPTIVSENGGWRPTGQNGIISSKPSRPMAAELEP